MEEELKVRVGTPEDLDDCMELAIAASAENSFVRPSPMRLLGEMWPALNRDRGIVGLIAPASGGKPEGIILLRIGNIWYSDDLIVEEKAIFIDPRFRSAKGGRAKKLCEFGKKVADELGLPLTIGVLSNNRTEGKIRMYQRIFGEPSGAYFLYGARTGAFQQPAEQAAE